MGHVVRSDPAGAVGDLGVAALAVIRAYDAEKCMEHEIRELRRLVDDLPPEIDAFIKSADKRINSYRGTPLPRSF